MGLRESFGFVGLLLYTLGVASGAQKEPSGDVIVAKAVARAQAAHASIVTNGYTYTKVTLTEEFDSSGNVKDRKERVYRVDFRDGATRLNLVEVNGHAPTEADKQKQAENEMAVQKIVGKGKSAKDSRENFLTPDLVGRFDFQLVGQKNINGREAYELSFRPKSPEPAVHRIVDRLLNRISVTLWIDAEEFELARAEIYLGSEVNLLGGIIGCLKKLEYNMTRTRVADGLWLNTFSTGDFEARKLLDSTRIKTKSKSSNFRLTGFAS